MLPTLLPHSARTRCIIPDQLPHAVPISPSTVLLRFFQAGTGKSTLLRTMIKALRYQHGDAAVAVTASTGAASTILGGTTIHSFSGCGIAVEE